MSLHKHQVFDSIRIRNNNNISIIPKSNKTFAPLSVSGSAVFGKGIQIGYSEQNIPGLLTYDGNNIMGFTQKNGWSLLSNNFLYNLIDISEINKEKTELNIDLLVEYDQYFYINVTDDLSKILFKINTVIKDYHKTSTIKLVINNKSMADFTYTFINDHIYIDNSISKKIIKEYKKDKKIKVSSNSVHQITFEIVSENLQLVNIKTYRKIV